MCTFYDLKSHGFWSPFQKFYARHLGIKSLVPTLQLLYSTYGTGTACKLLFLFGAYLLSFQWLLTASFFFDLPLAELSGVQKDLVGLGAIYVHNETHSAGISVGTNTNNLTLEDLFLQKKDRTYAKLVRNRS